MLMFRSHLLFAESRHECGGIFSGAEAADFQERRPDQTAYSKANPMPVIVPMVYDECGCNRNGGQEVKIHLMYKLVSTGKSY